MLRKMEHNRTNPGFGTRCVALATVGMMTLGSILTAGILPVQAAEDSDTTTAAEQTDPAAESSTGRLQENYTRVSAGYQAAAYQGEDVVIRMQDALEQQELLATDTYGYEDAAANLEQGEQLSLQVEVPETALYEIRFDYLSYDASILPIELAFRVDGSFPYYECRSLSFETNWQEPEQRDLDRYGNEIVALPEKEVCWMSKALGDASYRYAEPLLTELTKGSHSFEISVQEGSLLLGNLTLCVPEQITAYSGPESAEGDALIAIEAENFSGRNDSSIHAVGEYDPSLSPLSASEKVLNIIDEDSFRKAGQMVTYQFHADQAGTYKLAMNYRQSEKNDFPVFADVRVDGEIPNAEFHNLAIASSTNFSTRTFQDAEGQDLTLNLSEGDHTISLQITEDPIRYALEAVDRIMSEISDLSLEITKVAGTNKDKYRDLKLTRYIPGLQETLYGWCEELRSLAEQAQPYVDADKPEDVAAFSYLLIAANQLSTLAEEPDELVYRVDELSTSVNSINTQIANFVDLINSNDLAIDRIYLYQDGAKLPKGLGFFSGIGMSLKRFWNSFFGQSYSSSNTDPNHIQVWVNRPRQYVEIMQKMLDEQFTPQTGIEVDLSLMTDAQKLILSNASGDTPDIATGINYSIPYDLAIRGALVDMTKFDTAQEVFGRYSDGLLVPSVVGDGMYSLPETMNFYVMFYRTDILAKLGLEAPDTMEELIALLPDLQMRGLNVYYPTAAMLAMRNFHGTTPLIYQNGGTLYGDFANEITLDQESSVAGFTKLTELFTLYDMPVDVPNFYQHFRNGDIPIGIADFNSYNLILNAAPEIANSWNITLVPGTENAETGKVERYMSGGAESTVMFSSNDEREQRAWRFVDWWSSTEVQAEFGQRLQILYGDEYIWPTANLEAFRMLPYPTRDKDTIMEQAGYILEAPRLPGSYMMEREMSNAFNDVVVNGKSIRSEVDETVKIVQRETERKLEEFGYLDQDGNVIRPYETPSVEKVQENLRGK